MFGGTSRKNITWENKSSWEDNIKIDFRDICFEDGDWI